MTMDHLCYSHLLNKSGQDRINTTYYYQLPSLSFQERNPSVIVVQQPEGMAELHEAQLHGLHSDEYWEDDASSTASGGSSGVSSLSTSSSSQCQKFYLNLRLEVNERMLSSSDDEITSATTLSESSWQRQRMRRKRRRGRYFTNSYG